MLAALIVLSVVSAFLVVFTFSRERAHRMLQEDFDRSFWIAQLRLCDKDEKIKELENRLAEKNTWKPIANETYMRTHNFINSIFKNGMTLDDFAKERGFSDFDEMEVYLDDNAIFAYEYDEFTSNLAAKEDRTGWEIETSARD